MSHFPDDIRSFLCNSGRKSVTRLLSPHNDWYDFITELDGHVFPHDHKIPESKTAAMKVWTTTWDTAKGIGTMSYYRRGDQEELALLTAGLDVSLLGWSIRTRSLGKRVRKSGLYNLLAN